MWFDDAQRVTDAGKDEILRFLRALYRDGRCFERVYVWN